jgi:hypothetical protein
MAQSYKRSPHITSDQNAKEEIKNVIFLLWGKHILNTQAEEILIQYKKYINKDYVTIHDYTYAYYSNKYLSS